MTTPAKLARLLGWPEARRPASISVRVESDASPAQLAREVGFHLRRRPAFSPERPTRVPAAVVAEQDWPRLHVWKPEGCRVWWWDILSPDGDVLYTDCQPTHAQALAVGLAALEAASVAAEKVGVSPI